MSLCAEHCTQMMPTQIRVKMLKNRFIFKENDQIGSGNFGSVFRGNDIVGQRDVAIKVVPWQKFRVEELDCLLQLKDKSENVIQLVDYDQDQNFCYLVTEYCPGGDLQTHIQKMFTACRVSEEEAVNYLTQILRGMYCLV